MNIKNKLFLVFILCFAVTHFSHAIYAQEQEVIYFIDGSSVSGIIIELNREIIRLQQIDGKIIERSSKDIYKFSSGRTFREIYKQAIDSGKEERVINNSIDDKKAVIVSQHRFNIAPVVYNFKYDEPSISEKGWLSGINAGYEFNEKVLMINLNFEYLRGELEYEGETWAGTPITSDTEDYIYEFRFLVGGNAYYGKYKFTPLLGLGLRYWNNTIKGSGGYEREVIYYYTPIGFSLFRSLSTKWSWGFSAEYDLLWSGTVKSHLSDVDSGFRDTENSQNAGDGHGMRISIRLSNQFNQKLSWFIEPFFRYWDVSESDWSSLFYNGVLIGEVYEPRNDTTLFGFYLGLDF